MIPPPLYKKVGITIKFTHYPSMSFIEPRMLQITPSESPLAGLVQVQTNLQTKYKDIWERNVKMKKDTRQHIGASCKRLLTITNHKSNTLRCYVVQPTVPNPTSLSDWRDDEYQVDFNKFEKLDKVDFFKQTSYMICNEEVQSIKTKRKLRIALVIFEDLWKA